MASAYAYCTALREKRRAEGKKGFVKMTVDNCPARGEAMWTVSQGKKQKTAKSG